MLSKHLAKPRQLRRGARPDRGGMGLGGRRGGPWIAKAASEALYHPGNDLTKNSGKKHASGGAEGQNL